MRIDFVGLWLIFVSLINLWSTISIIKKYSCICTPELMIFSMECLRWNPLTHCVNYKRLAQFIVHWEQKQERLCCFVGSELHTENSWDSVKHSFTAACTRLMEFSHFHEYRAPHSGKLKQIVLTELKLFCSKLLPLRAFDFHWCEKMCQDSHIRRIAVTLHGHMVADFFNYHSDVFPHVLNLLWVQNDVLLLSSNELKMFVMMITDRFLKSVWHCEAL